VLDYPTTEIRCDWPGEDHDTGQLVYVTACRRAHASGEGEADVPIPVVRLGRFCRRHEPMATWFAQHTAV